MDQTQDHQLWFLNLPGAVPAEALCCYRDLRPDLGEIQPSSGTAQHSPGASQPVSEFLVRELCYVPLVDWPGRGLKDEVPCRVSAHDVSS